MPTLPQAIEDHCRCGKDGYCGTCYSVDDKKHFVLFGYGGTSAEITRVLVDRYKGSLHTVLS